MSAPPTDDFAPDFATWIGRSIRRIDVITPRLVEAFRATLAPHLAAVPGAPLGIHWCLAPDIVAPPDIGLDGHPRTGLFLPALPYTRRMWAGGRLEYHGSFEPGDVVTRTTTIADIALKTGRTGKLAFVTVRHAYHVDDRLILAERQDVVYRDADGTGSQPAARPAVERPVAAARTSMTTDPTLLFRYSALTFNSHRIHYDAPYATGVEGYGGLVVHGPLQATVLLNLAVDQAGAVPRQFDYRGQAPLLCGVSVNAEASERRAGQVELRIATEDGATTLSAEASWTDA